MKYLILGSSGQIGNALMDHAQSRGHKCLPFDIVDGYEYDLRWQSDHRSTLSNAIIDSDFTFFLAFDVGGSRYLKTYQDTYQFIDNNTRIIVNTFKDLQEFNKPFIFASSQMSNMVDSPYGVLKALGEHYTRSLGGISVKLWNVYGVEKDLNKSHVITDLILKAKKGRIDVESSGRERRQFLHANDCCDALLNIANNYDKLCKDKPFDVTTGKWTSIQEVAEIISDEFGKIPITYGSQKDLHYIRNEPVNFLPNWWSRIPVDVGIRDIIKYYESHT